MCDNSNTKENLINRKAFILITRLRAAILSSQKRKNHSRKEKSVIDFPSNVIEVYMTSVEMWQVQDQKAFKI